MKSKRIIIFLLLFISASIGAHLSFKYYQAYEKAKQERFLFEKRKAEWLALKQTVENDVALFKGEAGIVIKDLGTNWQISVNKDKLFPSASLVKIPIMAAGFNAAQEEKIKLEDTVRLKLSDIVSGSGMLKNMKIGTEFSIAKLIELMISNSDNTATNMLIDLLGFDYLNDFFKRSGLKNTNLSRRMMDFQYRKKGIENYTTAGDLAYLLENIYLRKFISPAASEHCLKLLKQQSINDRIPAKLPVSTLVAHKTGLERNVCHDAGIVFTSKGNFLIVALTRHANSNSVPSKEFIAKVSLRVYNYFEQLP